MPKSIIDRGVKRGRAIVANALKTDFTLLNRREVFTYMEAIGGFKLPTPSL